MLEKAEEELDVEKAGEELVPREQSSSFCNLE